jgi:CheY-like chemotaxis protein
VLCAPDGESALARFREHAPSIRAVLLDLQMPGAGGEATLAALRRIRPDVRVILVSGWPQEQVVSRFERPGEVAWLRKPYLPASLLEKVYSLLEG